MDTAKKVTVWHNVVSVYSHIYVMAAKVRKHIYKCCDASMRHIFDSFIESAIAGWAHNLKKTRFTKFSNFFLLQYLIYFLSFKGKWIKHY